MSFRVELAGRIAAAALRSGVGEIVAVFRRGCYARFEGNRFVCFGDASLGRGPLNALVVGYETPVLGSRTSVRLEGMQCWSAPAPGAAPRRHALAGLRAAAHRRIPTDGLGSLIVGASNHLINHARPALRALDAWLAGAEAVAKPAPAAADLIGLGPGLTPSGDDYLGGVMVALHACGRADRAGLLWKWLEPQLAARTSELSAAHLEAAAGSEAHETLHACMAGLAEPSEPEWDEPLAAVAALGHCSGWDSLAGAVAAARAFA